MDYLNFAVAHPGVGYWCSLVFLGLTFGYPIAAASTLIPPDSLHVVVSGTSGWLPASPNPETKTGFSYFLAKDVFIGDRAVNNDEPHIVPKGSKIGVRENLEIPVRQEAVMGYVPHAAQSPVTFILQIRSIRRHQRIEAHMVPTVDIPRGGHSSILENDFHVDSVCHLRNLKPRNYLLNPSVIGNLNQDSGIASSKVGAVAEVKRIDSDLGLVAHFEESAEAHIRQSQRYQYADNLNVYSYFLSRVGAWSLVLFGSIVFGYSYWQANFNLRAPLWARGISCVVGIALFLYGVQRLMDLTDGVCK